MATSKTNTSNKKTSGKDVKSLSKQLSQVSAQAKSLGINNADTRKADSMVRQTEAQGSKKYAGSAYDTEFQANEKVINSMTLKPTGTVKYPEYKDTPVPDYTMNNTGLTGGESGITTDGTNLNVEQPKDEYGALTKIYEDYNKSLTDAQDNMTTAADVQKKLERETQIKQLRQEEADYASQINTITANRDAAVLSLEGQGRGQTEGFIGGEQARINREAAIKALPIQAQLAAAQNKVQLAQDHINTWGAILMQDAQNKYNFKKEQFTALKDYLTDVEKMRLSKLEKENDRKYQEAQDLIKAKTSAISNALGQGAPASVVSAIKLAGTLEQVVTATGKYNADLLAQEAQRASIEASRTSTAKNKAEMASLTSPYNGEFSSVVDNASNLVGAERGKTSRVAIGNALAKGDYASAYALTGNNVEESLTGDTKTKFANARTDIAVMSGMRDAIQAYADAGGDMGFLKGTANDIARSLGQLTSDPQFASLAVQLQREFQAYRQNMTGAAFSPGESREYASVNPRTTASLDLNLATIDGALSQLENRVTSTINTRVPGASSLYEKVSGKQTGDVIDPRQAPTGTIVEIGGTKYKKVGDNEYMPI